jgi:predicted transcriptional regulator
MPDAEKRMNAILRILEHQHPPSVSEIASRVNTSEEKVELFLRFLAKYGFVTYDEDKKTATIRADSFSLKETSL